MSTRAFRDTSLVFVVPNRHIASRWHYKHGTVIDWSATLDVYLVRVDGATLALRPNEMRPDCSPIRSGDDKIKARGITGTFDWAVPHAWFEDVLNKGLPNPAGHVIWFYGDSTCGRPVGIDTIGDNIVQRMED